VDLPAQLVVGPDGARHAFEIDGFLKECLVRGQDELALTLGHAEAIAAFEARHREAMPWLAADAGARRLPPA
jgi:3-isopropylmalate/(R)-2-methylmalate dehydratase small subunit